MTRRVGLPDAGVLVPPPLSGAWRFFFFPSRSGGVRETAAHINTAEGHGIRTHTATHNIHRVSESTIRKEEGGQAKTLPTSQPNMYHSL